MVSERIPLQPTLRRLLDLEALSEAQVVSGKDFLDREISQIVTTMYGGQKEGTLALMRADALPNVDAGSLKGMSGLIVIKPVNSLRPSVSKGSTPLKSQVLPEIEQELDKVIQYCLDASTPLVVVPCLEDSRELIEEVRSSYLVEVKKAAARLHAYFVRLVIENGLPGFVEQLAEDLARPCAVETTDFKIVAAHNMGPTPANQQKTLTEELGEVLNRELRSLEDPHSLVDAVRIGRRLVAPIILEGAVVG